MQVRAGCAVVWLVAAVCMQASVRAQPPTAAGEEPDVPAYGEDDPDMIETRQMPQTIGGMPEAPRGAPYTSPLKTVGLGIGGTSFALSFGSGLIYLSVVYPFQALFGSAKPEPVMLWLLLPIIGPFMAQTRDLVKDKPAWRVVLLVDGALQATGLVVGLIGAALSGRRAREEASTATGPELSLGVAGMGLAGMTVTWHAM